MKSKKEHKRYRTEGEQKNGEIENEMGVEMIWTWRHG